MDDQRRAPLGTLLNALFLHGFVPELQNTIVPGGWSIGCEMGLYLAFPLLFRVLTSLRRALAAFACALDIVLVRIGHAKGWSTVPALGLYYHPAFQLPVFLAGIAAYQATRGLAPGGRKGRRCASWRPWRSRGWWSRVEIATAHPRLWAGEILPVAGFVGLLVYACVSAPPRLLTSPLMVLLGLVRFSVCIWHFAVRFGLLRRWEWIASRHGPLPLVLGFALTPALTWPLAELSRRFIELPGMALGRSLIEKARQRRRTPSPF